ncbi:helicase [Campylobacter sp. RM9344]|uniref:Helicase n=1 Tax=Campylobacter californiensis TaxID=1032243 RepID=A0AAW3ZUY7_9BACT|nr:MULTISPECIES: helicase [unclassified Campylobacter]MBE2985061.1 helicase [Campylobacter sp. RM6883]MBE2986604.1 helicase [Campylobacter sp. RM12919]MBE2987601.1 helicase [Campylobacter sp. RM12920]MBE2995614.1 helicase [Campylobacter sp. RM6913]MBE3029224.1 helicase [Campylobacter sp. RM9344]
MQNKILNGSLLNLETQRKVAKVGLGVSLGVVTLSAFGMKNKTIKALHIISGVALVGFSIYHHGLYNNGFAQKIITQQSKKRKKIALSTK